MSSSALIGSASPPDLHVMTFNIRRRMDGLAWRPADRWSRRGPILERLVRDERPTLLGVQEATPATAGAVKRALGAGYRFAGRGRGRDGRGEGCPLFFDDDRLELRAWRQLALSDRPTVAGSRGWGNPQPRCVIQAWFRDRETSVEFTVLNTHLDPFSRRSRAESARFLLGLVAREWRGSGEPAILMGDLNAGANSPALRELTRSALLTDAWSLARDRATPEWGTYGGYRPPRVGAPRIDWILVTRGVAVLRAGVNAFRDATGYPSDHLPVQALLRLESGR